MRGIRIKICGITSEADAHVVEAAGVDAVGINFYDRSPRSVSIEQARQITRVLGPFITSVGLFVNAEPERVRDVLAQVPLQLLQFHGDESADYCESFGRPYIKAIRMRPGLDVAEAIADYPRAQGILLDAYRPGVPGGTGETFDWDRVPVDADVPIILAGGLTPDNVAEAVSRTRPYGVDVSGGVESAPGKKDPEKVRAFILNARKAQ